MFHVSPHFVQYETFYRNKRSLCCEVFHVKPNLVHCESCYRNKRNNLPLGAIMQRALSLSSALWMSWVMRAAVSIGTLSQSCHSLATRLKPSHLNKIIFAQWYLQRCNDRLHLKHKAKQHNLHTLTDCLWWWSFLLWGIRCLAVSRATSSRRPWRYAPCSSRRTRGKLHPRIPGRFVAVFHIPPLKSSWWVPCVFIKYVLLI